MSKVSQVPSAVVSFLRQASASVGQSRGAIHWSSGKKKFIKANNKTIADESQVLEYLNRHPDQINWERAIMHIGPGVPPPAGMLANVGSPGVEISALEDLVEKYQAGVQRNHEELLNQTGEVLRQLGETNQFLVKVGPQLTNQDQASQQLVTEISNLQDKILGVAEQLKNLEGEFGSNREKLAEAVAFNTQLHDLLTEVRQKLQDLEDRVGQMNDAQRATFVRTTASSASYPSLTVSLLALLAGIVVTMVAIREEGQLLDIPAIWWGIIALTIAFFSMYAWIGRQAEPGTETIVV